MPPRSTTPTNRHPWPARAALNAEQIPTGSGSEFTTAGATFHLGPAAEVQITADNHTAAHQLRYFIGAGVAGRSYLYEVGNYLFQSPVAWYSLYPPVEPFTRL